MLQTKIDLSGTGGLVPSFNKLSKEFIQYGQENQLVSGFWNPFVNPGYMSPVRTYKKELTNSSGTTNKTCIYDEVTGLFLTAGDSYITVYASLDATNFSSSRSESNVLAILDFEIYQLNGVRKIFYTSRKSGAGYIGVTDGTDFQYDWSNGGTNSALYTGSVTNPATLSNAGSFLRVASNGYMYAFDPTFVHKIDGTLSTGGTAGTLTINVFGVNDTQRIVDAVDWRNKMFIAVQDNATPYTYSSNVNRLSRQAGVYIWDRISTTGSTKDFIPIYGVKEIRRVFVAHDGKLRLFTVGASNQLQLREYSGSSFDVIFEFDQSASFSTLDGVTISDYGTFWIGNDYNVYCHGRPSYGYGNGIYKIGKLANGTVNTVGYCYFANGNEPASGTDALFISYTNTGSANNKIQKFLPNYSGSVPSGFDNGAAYASAQYTRNIQLPKLCTADGIYIFVQSNNTADAGEGTAIVGNITVGFNEKSTVFKTQNITRKDIRAGYLYIPLGKQYVTSIQFGIDYTSSTNTTLGTFDMLPNYAILEYTNTTAKK